MDSYRPRIADRLLKYRLEETGAILIEGPKWCGKTTTAEQEAGSIIYMDDPDRRRQYLQMARLKVSSLLDGATPRLIDEWQLAPKLWDAIRFAVDHRQKDGQFILTGSAVPASTENITHSGAGRFSWITMRPMSLWESGESSGEVSLAELFAGNCDISGHGRLSLEDMAFLTCRGGWPAALSKGRRAALHLVYDYVDAVVRTDISRVDGIGRDPERARRLLRSYSRHQGSQAATEVIRQDMVANGEDTFAVNTLISYMTALKKIFVIDDMPAWNPNLRSKTAIRTGDTRYFADPSIAAASLGLGPDDLMNDLETFGLLFETLCVRDLRTYADALEGQVFHYRDKDGLECDAVVHLRNGSYGLIEIKLGGDDAIEHGAKTLALLSKKIDTAKMKAAAFKMILTAIGDYAFQRTDGVLVVPIGCLKD